MNDNVIDLYNNPKFNLKRLPTVGDEEAVGCHKCGNFLFVVVINHKNSVLRCSSCYGNLEKLIVTETPKVIPETPLISTGVSDE